MFNMLKLNYAEFYITNVCNLACKGCNRFNSFNFKGYQRWSEYKNTYKKWSKILKLESFGILGGEPLLNPEIIDWIIGTTDLWPDALVRISTNGFQINKVKDLYNTIKQRPKLLMSVGIHNKMHKKEIMNLIENFLVAPLRYEFDNKNKYAQEMYVVDANDVVIRVQYNWWFHQGAIIPNENGNLTLHNSDPVKSHSICHSAQCHHFQNGKLYKCGAAALFPDFDRQVGLDLSEQDRNLINSVNFITAEDDIAIQNRFIKNLSNPIPQCKFCPEIYLGDQIFALKKKDI